MFCLNCCEVVEIHPYDGRISGETGINAKNIALIEERCRGKENIRFAFTGDTQGWFDDTGDFVKSVNKREDIDFVIHGGDITDFGLTKEFIWMRDVLNKLDMPYVVILGNHDCLANGKEIFNKVFGEDNYSFIAGTAKFVCLNTNALEFDYSHPVPDFQYIRNELEKKEEHTKTVVAMHIRPLLSEEFNNNVAPMFQHMIKLFPGLQFCLNAHDHNVQIVDIFDDGVIYYGTDCIHKRSYSIFTLHSDETYDYEVVEF